MGNLYTEQDKLSGSGSNLEELDWRVGDLNRFIYKIAWIENDDVTWKIRNNRLPRIKVRKFIEQCCSGDVYVTSDSESIITDCSRYALGPRCEIKWILLSFEYEEDLSLFILKFSESNLQSIDKKITDKNYYLERTTYKPYNYIKIAKKYNEKRWIEQQKKV